MISTLSTIGAMLLLVTYHVISYNSKYQERLPKLSLLSSDFDLLKIFTDIFYDKKINRRK